MNNFSDGWKIGTTSYIDQRQVKFRASSTDISDRLLNGNSRHLNSLNQYLYSFLNISTKVIFKVVAVEESEKTYGPDASNKFSDKYIFTALPLGEIVNRKFQPGVIDIPMVGSNIYACDSDDLLTIFNNYEEGTKIGSLSGYPNIRPTIDLDLLFSGHMAILGNTGSGKSTTARLLIKSIYNQLNNPKKYSIKSHAKFIIFDLHGDYKNIIEKNGRGKYLKNNEYFLPVGELDINDWASILSPSQRVQRPLLERAVKYSFLNEEGQKRLYAAFSYNAIEDTSVDSHAARKFQIMKYFQHIQNELKLPSGFPKRVKLDKSNSLYIDSEKKLMRAFSLYYGNISDDIVTGLQNSLLKYIGDRYMDAGLPDKEKILNENCFLKTKDEITIEDLEKALEFVFSEEEVLGNRQARAYSEGLVTQLHNLKDKYSNNLFNKNGGTPITKILSDNNGISIIDVSQIIDDDGLKLFSNFVARHLFEKNRNNKDREDFPIYLIFDEAHRYIKEGIITDDSIFNRIAREGRKFGVNLTVISQIPSELSRIVLSQTSTFIIHRIQNSLDLEYIRKNVPAISNDQVSRLPYFAPGMAAMLGSSMRIPMEISIDGTYKDDTPPISMRITKDKINN